MRFVIMAMPEPAVIMKTMSLIINSLIFHGNLYHGLTFFL